MPISDDEDFFFLPQLTEAMQNAPSDPDEAAKVLLLCAELLRNGEPLPTDARQYIADAFESAALKPAPYRASTLAEELYLTAKNRRPAGNYFEIGEQVEYLIGDLSLTKAIARVAEKTGVSKSTVRKYHLEYLEAKEEHDRINREEGF